MGMHDGHRARMKARFVRSGLDNFDDHSVLELLLFYAVPRRDVNELAHALLDHFGTLDAVFEASFEDMMCVPGVGENVATLLTLIAYANLATTIVAVEKHASNTPARRWLTGIAVAVLELLAVIALTQGFLLIPNLDQAQQLARFAAEMTALLAALALKVRALTTSRQRP